MTEIDLKTGELLFDGNKFASVISTTDYSHEIKGIKYHHLTFSELRNNSFDFNATGYYRNNKLASITLNLSTKWINENYRQKKEIDYITPFVDFYKLKTNDLLDSIMQTPKRNFEWGKIQTKVDPRNPSVFVEIKYFKLP